MDALKQDALAHKEVRQFIEEKALKAPFTIKLNKAIDWEEDATTELTVEREANAGDYELMPTEKQTFGDHYRPISKMLGKPETFVKKLSVADIRLMMEVSTYFFGGSE